jgi:nicotinamide-nucleotide amidase
MTTQIYELAEKLGAALKSQKLTLVTAESCTGGWIGEAVTAVPGSSEWYERGFITYTNIAKREMLGVQEATLAKFRAVSIETVKEMASGALAHSHAQVAVSVSGVAGPTGGTPAKPVGTVCIAWQRAGGEAVAQTLHFGGDREAVRRESVICALEGLLKLVAAR